LVRRDAEVALRLTGALWWYWFVRDYWTEGRRWLEEALVLVDGNLASADEDERLVREVLAAPRAKALEGAGMLARYQGDYGRAAALCADSLGVYRQLGDKAGIAAALDGLATIARNGGNYVAARAMYAEVLGLRREAGDRQQTAYCLSSLAYVLLLLGDLPAARPLALEALEIARALGAPGPTGYALCIVGAATRLAGDLTAARALLTEALAIARQVGHTYAKYMTLCYLAELTLAEGDAAAARPLYEECLALTRQSEAPVAVATCLEGLAGVAVAQGQPEGAARLLGAAEAVCESIEWRPPPVLRTNRDRTQAAARAALGEAKFVVRRSSLVRAGGGNGTGEPRWPLIGAPGTPSGCATAAGVACRCPTAASASSRCRTTRYISTTSCPNRGAGAGVNGAAPFTPLLPLPRRLLPTPVPLDGLADRPRERRVAVLGHGRGDVPLVSQLRWHERPQAQHLPGQHAVGPAVQPTPVGAGAGVRLVAVGAEAEGAPAGRVGPAQHLQHQGYGAPAVGAVVERVRIVMLAHHPSGCAPRPSK
jgi:tetratricopeptide (TPR) repeat protein